VTVQKGNASLATLIGDVVSSRSAPDRQRLHDWIGDVLAQANERFEAVGTLRITVGDEYQASYADLGTALSAALWLRVRLQPEADLRHGIGWGAVSVLEESPRVEDGPGWWAARAAIEHVKQQARSAATRRTRTAYRLAEGMDGPDPALVNAALLCRDQLVGGLSERSMRLLAGLLDGVSQAALADQEGISGSAVSQRVRGDGLAVILTASELLGGVR